MDTSLIIWIVITLILSAFFSGIEIAYLAANKLRIEVKNQKGVLAARILSYFIKNPSHFLTTTLLGNNIALIMYGIYSSELIAWQLSHYVGVEAADRPFTVFLIQTLLSSVVVLVLAEFIPKAIFRNYPNPILSALSLPFLLVFCILYPLVIFISFLSRWILTTIFKVNITKVAPVFSRYDLMHYVSEGRPSDDEHESEVDTQIIKNAIEFRSLKVRECMVPRTEVLAIEVESSIEILRQKFSESGHSKVIVYRKNIDNVIGYAHLVDLYKQPKSIDKIVMPILIATESMPASELLKQLIAKRRSIAVVVDEFGGTSGVITIEDIVEEIIGDIEDEHDVDEFTEKVVSPTEFIFSARLEIDYINEKYGLSLPEGDYDTLGGLIFFTHHNMPQPEEIISFPPFEFTVLNVEPTRIGDVKIRLLDKS